MTILGFFIPVWLLIPLFPLTLAGLMAVYLLIAKYSTLLFSDLMVLLWDKKKLTFEDIKEDIEEHFWFVLLFWWLFSIVGIIGIIAWLVVSYFKIIAWLVVGYFKFLGWLVRKLY